MDTISENRGTIDDPDARQLFRMPGFTSLLDRFLRLLDMNRELHHLSELDDRMLRDIGISRADIARAQRELFRPGGEQ